jgi:aspartyl protease family protein
VAVGLVALAFIYIEQSNLTIERLSAVDTSSLAVKVAILIFVGVAALALFRERFSQALRSVLIWIVIALALALGYTYRFELRELADRVLAEFVPGHAATR